MVRNAGDPEQVRTAARVERERQARQRADLKALLQRPEFRRWVRQLVLEDCGLQRSSYLNNISGRGSDPVFHEGQRFIGKRIYDQIAEVDFRSWLLAEAEAYELSQQQQPPHEDSDDVS